MKKFDFDELDKAEWLKLGFFYSYNEEMSRWEFYGDRSGLQNFYKELIAYVDSQKNFGFSEHIHLGPYQYLKIVTWGSPIIKKDGFYGSLEDLKKLADIFIMKLNATQVSDCFTISEDYSRDNEASLLVYLKEDGFDPSSLD
jgi:hypothetical protein